MLIRIATSANPIFRARRQMCGTSPPHPLDGDGAAGERYDESKEINLFKLLESYNIGENMKSESDSAVIDNMPQDIIKATIQLAVIKAKKSPLIEYMQKNIKREVDINEVRSRLAKISGSLSQEIIEGRAERT